MRSDVVNPQDFIFDANPQNFNSLVLDKSEQGPVLVHFWSRKSDMGFHLDPLFENLIQTYSGSFFLINLSIEEHWNICTDYNISSLPALQLFIDRKVVDTLSGHHSETDICFMLDQYIVSENDIIIRDALTLYHEGDKASAYQKLGHAALENPRYYKLPLTIASLMLLDRKHEQALKLLDNLPQAIQHKPVSQRLKVELEFAWISEPVKEADELKAFIQQNPHQLPALAMLAAWHVTQKEFSEALQLFHQIMQQDRKFENDFGRRSIVKILLLLKPEDPLIEHYRNLI